MNLPAPQKQLLLALAQGATLKSHRYLDGTKLYKLHLLTGEAEMIDPALINA